jgi:hypothetical protein
VNIELSNHNRSAYKNLLLWLLGEAIIGFLFYELLSYLPDAAQVVLLLVAIVVIWRDPVFPRRTTKSYATLHFWLPVALGLFCAVHVENNWPGCLGKIRYRLYIRESCL